MQDDFFNMLAKQNINYEALIPDHASTIAVFEQSTKRVQDSYGYTFSLRILPLEHFSPLVGKHITGDLVLTMSRRKQQAIIIENRDIADAERQNFNMIWEYAGMIEGKK